MDDFVTGFHKRKVARLIEAKVKLPNVGCYRLRLCFASLTLCCASLRLKLKLGPKKKPGLRQSTTSA